VAPPRARLLLAALSALALAGCSGDSAGTTGTVPTQAQVAPSSEWSWETQASPDFPRADGFAYLAGVRAAPHGAGARHPRFDRIVLELVGDAPSWRVGFEAPPIVEDPSGLTVDVEGDAFLRIALHPASAVDRTGDAPEARYDGPDRIPVDGHVVRELVQVTDRDGALTWVAGLSHQAPFTVTLLEDPPRLVVDVVDDNG